MYAWVEAMLVGRVKDELRGAGGMMVSSNVRDGRSSMSSLAHKGHQSSPFDAELDDLAALSRSTPPHQRQTLAHSLVVLRLGAVFMLATYSQC